MDTLTANTKISFLTRTLASVQIALLFLLFLPLPASAQSSPIVTNGSASFNWAGYVAKTHARENPVTAVSGTWVVPRVQPEDGQEHISADAIWVGIGGVGSGNLIQAGTQAIVDPGSGVMYEAWYELLPDRSRTVPLEVTAGDEVHVTIEKVEIDRWSIRIENRTSGESFNRTVTYDSVQNSAEWIAEAPLSYYGILPLDQFGSVTFREASATVNGEQKTPEELNAKPYLMVGDEDSLIAAPSAIENSGNSFTVHRVDSAEEEPMYASPAYPNEQVSDANLWEFVARWVVEQMLESDHAERVSANGWNGFVFFDQLLNNHLLPMIR